LRDKEVMDVDDVPSGLDCQCVCPACGIRLVARKGKVNRAHFAHYANDAISNQTKVCEYAFETSVRLMIHSLASDSDLQIQLPPYRRRDPRTRKIVKIAKENLMTLSSPFVKTGFYGVTTDLLYEVDGSRLVFFVFYKGRPVPNELKNLQDELTGVIGIDIDEFKELCDTEAEKSYQNLLRDFIEQDIMSKVWLYHPREIELRKQYSGLSDMPRHDDEEDHQENDMKRCGICGTKSVGLCEKCFPITV